LFPFRWDVVGQPAPKVVIGKGSGIDSIKAKLKELGIQTSEEEAMNVLAAVKQYSLETKALLTDQEFRQVVKATIPQAVAALEAST
jgi:isopropylmalate/homocitrate/citramalate synthase